MTFKEISSIITLVLGAIATFYSAVAPLWGFPYVQEVVGTLTALATLIATVLGAMTVKKVIDRNNNGIPDDEETSDTTDQNITA